VLRSSGMETLSLLRQYPFSSSSDVRGGFSGLGALQHRLPVTSVLC